MTWLTWFMVFKGLKNVEAVKLLKASTFEAYGEGLVLLLMWGGYTLLVHLILVVTHRRGASTSFRSPPWLGMIAMAFAFGQNDLANAASPGLSALTLWQHGGSATDWPTSPRRFPSPMGPVRLRRPDGLGHVHELRPARHPRGSRTPAASSTTLRCTPRAGARLGRGFLRLRRGRDGPGAGGNLDETGKKVHYDTLRASVITGVAPA